MSRTSSQRCPGHHQVLVQPWTILVTEWGHPGSTESVLDSKGGHIWDGLGFLKVFPELSLLLPFPLGLTLGGTEVLS
jgi:hypothetical protein